MVGILITSGRGKGFVDGRPSVADALRMTVTMIYNPPKSLTDS